VSAYLYDEEIICEDCLNQERQDGNITEEPTTISTLDEAKQFESDIEPGYCAYCCDWMFGPIDKQ
jgi:hypothetical protein